MQTLTALMLGQVPAAISALDWCRTLDRHDQLDQTAYTTSSSTHQCRVEIKRSAVSHVRALFMGSALGIMIQFVTAM